jgi:hypothetical protein
VTLAGPAPHGGEGGAGITKSFEIGRTGGPADGGGEGPLKGMAEEVEEEEEKQAETASHSPRH